MSKTEKLKAAQKRARALQKQIIAICAINKLNLTVHEGKIGFVDQELRKIVAVWEPKYKMSDIPKKTGGEAQ